MQNIQNHVAIIVDSSGSMSSLTSTVKKVFEQQIASLRKQSVQFEQETRVSVYHFNTHAENLVWDMDVTRLEKIPDYRVTGYTALMDAVKLAVDDFKEIPQKYGNHAFLIYVLTDGEENQSKISRQQFSKLIESLPENYTLVSMVPNTDGRRFCENLGFPKNNIDKWDTSERGLEEVGKKFEKSMGQYFSLRSAGKVSTSSFAINTDDIDLSSAKKSLNKVKKYELVCHPGTDAVKIREFVEKETGKPYRMGSAYYELVKTEHIQPQKNIAIFHKKSKEVYEGREARNMIGLPDHEQKVSVGDFGDWVVFVQSTSVNRNIIPKQRVLVI